MSTTVTRPVDAGSASTSPPRRPLASRISRGHLLLLAAVLVAGISNFAVLRGSEDAVDVTVAARDLPSGTVLTAADLTVAAVGVEAAGDVGLVAGDASGSVVGAVLATDLTAGDALRPGDVRPAAAEEGLRRMSLPIGTERAVAGAVAIGDRIDVLATTEGRSEWILGDVTVQSVGGGGEGGAFGDISGAYSLTVVVDAEQARCLATALSVTEITVVLATGTEPVVADGCEVLFAGARADADEAPTEAATP